MAHDTPSGFDAFADEHGIPPEDRPALRDVLDTLTAPADLLMAMVRTFRTDDVAGLAPAIEVLRDDDLTELVLVVAVALLSEHLPDPLPDAAPEDP